MIIKNKLFSLFLSLLIVVTITAYVPSASANERSAEMFRTHAYSGDFENGAKSLATIVQADPNDHEAKFGLGALQFFTAVKNLQHSLYKFGAGNRDSTRRRRSFITAMVPVLRFPVPANPNPEIATYTDVRETLTRFVSDLQRAEKTLSAVGNVPVNLEIEPFKIAVDVNNDGTISSNETLLGAYLSLTRRGARRSSLQNPQIIAFDTADVTWLQGYCNALMAISEFFLAFDFENTFDTTFHALFGLEATKFGQDLKKMKGDPTNLAALQNELKLIRKKRSAIRINSVNRAKKSILRRELSQLHKMTNDKIQPLRRQMNAFRSRQDQRKLLKLKRDLNIKRRSWRKVRGDLAERAKLQTVMDGLTIEIKKLALTPKNRLTQTRLRNEISKISRDLRPAKRKLQKLIAATGFTPEQLASRRLLRAQMSDTTSQIRKIRGGNGGIFDLVSFVHTLNWKVVSPKRLSSVRTRLLKVMQLNHITWQRVMAETDDHHEWLPNAKQTSPFPWLKIDQPTIDAWLNTVKLAGDVLEGRKLLPHPRLLWGVNLKTFFEQAKHFDAVMFITGPGAVPYLEKGDNVVSNQTWQALRQPFNRRFGSFAVWFN